MGHRCGVSGTRRSMRQLLLPVGRKSSGVGRHDFWKMWSQAAPAWGRKRHARRHESRRTTPTASARTTCPPRGKPQVGSRRAESGTGDAPNQRWRRACTGSRQRRSAGVNGWYRCAVPEARLARLPVRRSRRSETRLVRRRNAARRDAPMVAAHGTFPDQGQSSSPPEAGGCTHPDSSSRARWKARPMAMARTIGVARPASRLRTKVAPIAAKECNSR
jgi:hypothetical protein